MNLPNKLTVLRCIMTPLFLLALLWAFPYHYIAALVLFSAASLTDLFDGKIARARGLVTNLGKFLDPLADKTLTTAAFLGFMVKLPSAGLCWAVMLILTREFMVMSVRLLAAKDGVVIAASMAGKAKTVLQMVSILYMLAALQAGELIGEGALTSGLLIAGQVLIWIAVAATVISGIQYVWACRHYFTDTADGVR